MAERKLPTRAAILAAGCIMFLFTGTIYAWSILSSPFPVEFGWTSAQLGLNFTIVMSCFCIGGLAGSFVTRRLSARVTVLIGAVMCFLGYFLCSRITAQSLWLLYISYGGLIGLGVGFSYNAVLGTVVGWFPDKKGFASGVLLMGFGCSTLIMGNLADRLFNSAMAGAPPTCCWARPHWLSFSSAAAGSSPILKWPLRPVRRRLPPAGNTPPARWSRPLPFGCCSSSSSVPI